MKRFTISLVLVLFIASATLSHYSAECMKRGFDWAVLNVHGVLCYVNKPELKIRYIFLRELVERENAPKSDNPLQSDPLYGKDI